MAHLFVSLFGGDDIFGNSQMGLWMFLSISTVALFVVFIPLVTWMDTKRKEREAFYKAETFRRLAESSGEGAKAAIAMLREEDRLKRLKTLEGMKIAGVINVGVGVGLTVFMSFMFGTGHGSPWLVGLIPGLIGVGMLAYVFFLAEPVL